MTYTIEYQTVYQYLFTSEKETIVIKAESELDAEIKLCDGKLFDNETTKTSLYSFEIVAVSS